MAAKLQTNFDWKLRLFIVYFGKFSSFSVRLHGSINALLIQSAEKSKISCTYARRLLLRSLVKSSVGSYAYNPV